MIKRILSIICVLSLFFIFNYPVYAVANDDYIVSWQWDSLGGSGSTAKYYAYKEAVSKTTYDGRSPSNIPTYEQYKNDPIVQRNIDVVGRRYIQYNNNDGFYVVGSRVTDGDEQSYNMFIQESEDYGLANYGTGNFNGPANNVSNQQRDEFYSTVSHSNPTNYNCGNGYSFKVEMICDNSTSPTSFVTYQTTYFNGNEISAEEKHRTSGFRGTDNVYQYDFWITKSDLSLIHI